MPTIIHFKKEESLDPLSLELWKSFEASYRKDLFCLVKEYEETTESIIHEIEELVNGKRYNKKTINRYIRLDCVIAANLPYTFTELIPEMYNVAPEQYGKWKQARQKFLYNANELRKDYIQAKKQLLVNKS